MARSTIKNNPILLEGTLNFYFDPSGDDFLGDGSMGNPWQSLPKAKSFIENLRFSDQSNIILNFADGSYPDPNFFTSITVPQGLTVSFKGNDSDPTAVIFPNVFFVLGRSAFAQKVVLEDLTLSQGFSAISTGFEGFNLEIPGTSVPLQFFDCKGRLVNWNYSPSGTTFTDFVFENSTMVLEGDWEVNDTSGVAGFITAIRSTVKLNSIDFTGTQAPLSQAITLSEFSFYSASGTNLPSNVTADGSSYIEP